MDLTCDHTVIKIDDFRNVGAFFRVGSWKERGLKATNGDVSKLFVCEIKKLDRAFVLVSHTHVRNGAVVGRERDTQFVFEKSREGVFAQIAVLWQGLRI